MDGTYTEGTVQGVRVRGMVIAHPAHDGPAMIVTEVLDPDGFTYYDAFSGKPRKGCSTQESWDGLGLQYVVIEGGTYILDEG